MRTAYYLIHSMGRGANPSDDFAKRDRAAAVNFGEAARAAGVERVVYLGGLGPTGPDASLHLRSRHEVAELLAQRVPELRLRARRDGDRAGQRLVRDAAPPRQAAPA